MSEPSLASPPSPSPAVLRILHSPTPSSEPQPLTCLSPPLTYERLSRAAREAQLEQSSSLLQPPSSSTAADSIVLIPSPKFQYIDGDGDVITVSSEKELSEMMRHRAERAAAAAATGADSEAKVNNETHQQEEDNDCILLTNYQQKADDKPQSPLTLHLMQDEEDTMQSTLSPVTEESDVSSPSLTQSIVFHPSSSPLTAPDADGEDAWDGLPSPAHKLENSMVDACSYIVLNSDGSSSGSDDELKEQQPSTDKPKSIETDCGEIELDSVGSTAYGSLFKSETFDQVNRVILNWLHAYFLLLCSVYGRAARGAKSLVRWYRGLDGWDQATVACWTGVLLCVAVNITVVLVTASSSKVRADMEASSTALQLQQQQQQEIQLMHQFQHQSESQLLAIAELQHEIALLRHQVAERTMEESIWREQNTFSARWASWKSAAVEQLKKQRERVRLAAQQAKKKLEAVGEGIEVASQELEEQFHKRQHIVSEGLAHVLASAAARISSLSDSVELSHISVPMLNMGSADKWAQLAWRIESGAHTVVESARAGVQSAVESVKSFAASALASSVSSLYDDDEPSFSERLQAWWNTPIVRFREREQAIVRRAQRDYDLNERW